MHLNLIVIATILLACGVAVAQDDPYLWLEDITGDRAMQWVQQQDAKTVAALCATPEFNSMRARLLANYNSPERIPFLNKYGAYYYNYWQDAQHVRGLLRRTTLEQYRLAQPAWETVLDLDRLASDEKENWVWGDIELREPEYDRCLVDLSRGGADAGVLREFDLNTKRFVDGGFSVPEAKSQAAWRDRDTVYVATDFGPGTLTQSGYARLVKQWKRGTPLADAVTVFQGQPQDMSVHPIAYSDHGRYYEFMDRSTTIFNDVLFVRRGDEWVHVPKPDDADWGTFGDYLLINLRTDWAVGGSDYKAGTLLAVNFDEFLKGDRHFDVLFRPGERTTLESFDSTKNFVILNEMDNVHSRPVLLHMKDGRWTPMPLDVPSFASVRVRGVDSSESDEMFVTTEDFLTPPSFSLRTAGQPGIAGNPTLKTMPALFNADGLAIEQHEAVSKDGTRVPYFLVGPKNLKLDGAHPTYIFGYGGFEISLTPSYSPTIGAAWLERGGVYVLANIRGGGEFGPEWHDAARKEHRQRAYDDFEAIVEDLIARGVTSPKRLGIMGRSNGGLLMGVMLTQRPDLFGAVVCGSPLLDMRRYSHLLAGASWMDEYGDPDIAQDWAYIRPYSPYQNVVKGRKYPPVLFTTSTRDDRVHPGHARKMAALMEEQGDSVLYYENVEGGHGAAANNEQQAFMQALSYTFLWKELRE